MPAAAKGTKANPFTREEYSALEKESRLICSHEGERGAWWKAQDGPRFVAKGEGIRGRTEGSTNEGAGNSRRFNAARLKLSAPEFVALVPAKVDDGTPGSPLYAENLKARQEKAATGLTLLQSLMEKVKVDLPETAERKVTRPRTPAEMSALLAECNGDFPAFAAKMAAIPEITEVIPATKGGKVTLAELANQGAASVPAGAQSDVRRYVMESVNAAFDALSA
jgi:hypothetical protein